MINFKVKSVVRLASPTLGLFNLSELKLSQIWHQQDSRSNQLDVRLIRFWFLIDDSLVSADCICFVFCRFPVFLQEKHSEWMNLFTHVAPKFDPQIKVKGVSFHLYHLPWRSNKGQKFVSSLLSLPSGLRKRWNGWLVCGSSVHADRWLSKRWYRESSRQKNQYLHKTSR